MRIIRLFLATLVFIPFISNAQERELNETILLLTTANGEGYEDLAEGCAWATPYIPTEIMFGGVSDLRGVVTKNEKGLIRKKDGDVVGELWNCVGDLEDGVDPNFTDPENPPLKRTIAFVLTIGDDVYGALGEWSQKTGYEGLPQESWAAIWGGSAAIVHIVDGLPAGLAGAMTYNLIDSETGGFRNMIMTVRLYEPRNQDLEAAGEAMRRLYN